MLAQKITYTDYNGIKKTKTFYFNLNKREIQQLALGNGQMSYQQYLLEIANANDVRRLTNLVKDIILMAYGERSDDGESFIKNDKIREKFEYSAAFDELYDTLSSDEEAAARFFVGLLPPNLRGEAGSPDDVVRRAKKDTDQMVKRFQPDTSMFVEAKPIGEAPAEEELAEVIELKTDANADS